MSDSIVVTDDGAVRVIRMNRPEKKNALTQPMYAAMTRAMREAEANEAIRCLTTWLRPNTVGLAPSAWAGRRNIAMGPAPSNVRPGRAAILARQAPYDNVG